MINYYVNMDAQFECDEDIKKMEKKHNLVIVNTTKFQIQLCHSRGEEYRGPNTYMFIGDWKDIVNYFLFDYFLEDIEELEELVKGIQSITI